MSDAVSFVAQKWRAQGDNFSTFLSDFAVALPQQPSGRYFADIALTLPRRLNLLHLQNHKGPGRKTNVLTGSEH